MSMAPRDSGVRNDDDGNWQVYAAQNDDADPSPAPELGKRPRVPFPILQGDPVSGWRKRRPGDSVPTRDAAWRAVG